MWDGIRVVVGAEWPRSASNPPPGPIDLKAVLKRLKEKYPNGIVCYPDPPAKAVKTTTALLFEQGHGAVVLAADHRKQVPVDRKKLWSTGRTYRPSNRSRQLIRTCERYQR